jgi:hypothetical protein
LRPRPRVALVICISVGAAVELSALVYTFGAIYSGEASVTNPLQPREAAAMAGLFFLGICAFAAAGLVSTGFPSARRLAVLAAVAGYMLAPVLSGPSALGALAVIALWTVPAALLVLASRLMPVTDSGSLHDSACQVD